MPTFKPRVVVLIRKHFIPFLFGQYACFTLWFRIITFMGSCNAIIFWFQVYFSALLSNLFFLCSFLVPRTTELWLSHFTIRICRHDGLNLPRAYLSIFIYHLTFHSLHGPLFTTFIQYQLLFIHFMWYTSLFEPNTLTISLSFVLCLLVNQEMFSLIPNT